MFSEKIVKTWILGLSAPPILFLIKMKLVIYNKYFYTSNFKWITGMILLIKYQHLMDKKLYYIHKARISLVIAVN